MVKHIVMFQFTDNVNDRNRKEILDNLSNSVDNMALHIPGLLKAELGISCKHGTHDIVLYAEFETEECVDVFNVHPLHIAHRKMAKDYVCNRAVIDYVVS